MTNDRRSARAVRTAGRTIRWLAFPLWLATLQALTGIVWSVAYLGDLITVRPDGLGPSRRRWPSRSSRSCLLRLP
jgi:hypothetical protein